MRLDPKPGDLLELADEFKGIRLTPGPDLILILERIQRGYIDLDETDLDLIEFEVLVLAYNVGQKHWLAPGKKAIFTLSSLSMWYERT
jgi:hypothetical protein